MNWLRCALSSSVGKKFLMAITGLLLCGFLVAHLAGNLLLFVGADAYNGYAHKLHENEPVLMVAETGLALIFVVHLVLAFRLTAENKLARMKGYAEKQTKQDDLILKVRPDSWMLISGLALLAYIVLHIIDFKLGMRVSVESLEPYDKAVKVLKNPITIVGYLVGFVFLLAHLSHGFSSAFQSLGLNHPKYNNCIKWFGVAFAVAISLGNMSLVLWAMGQ